MLFVQKSFNYDDFYTPSITLPEVPSLKFQVN